MCLVPKIKKITSYFFLILNTCIKMGNQYPLTLKRSADLLNYENKIFVSEIKSQKISENEEINIYPLNLKRSLRLLDYEKSIKTKTIENRIVESDGNYKVVIKTVSKKSYKKTATKNCNKNRNKKVVEKITI